MAQVCSLLTPISYTRPEGSQFVAGRLYEVRAKMQAGPVDGETDAEKLPLLQRMLLHRVFATNECMPDRDIISEGMGHL